MISKCEVLNHGDNRYTQNFFGFLISNKKEQAYSFIITKKNLVSLFEGLLINFKYLVANFIDTIRVEKKEEKIQLISIFDIHRIYYEIHNCNYLITEFIGFFKPKPLIN